MSGSAQQAKAGKVVLQILRFLAFACGVAVVAMAVLGLFALEFLFNSKEAFENGITAVISSFFLLLFGILICLAELRVYKVLKWFAFLTTFTGCGLFYIMVGLLVLGIRIRNEPDVPIGLIIGGIVIAVGLINLLLACFVPQKGPRPTLTGVANA